MAATQSNPPDRVAEDQPANPEKMKEQPLSAQNETSASSQNFATLTQPSKAAPQSGSFGSVVDFTGSLHNICAPQAQSAYRRGYENPMGEWDEHPSYVDARGLDITSPGGYSDNTSVIFHAGYGYSPQMPYGPYSPGGSPLLSAGGDAQLYSPQQFPFSGPPTYYQQAVPPSIPYISSRNQISQPELSTTLLGVDQIGDHNNLLVGTRTSYPPPPSPPVGSFVGGGRFHGNLGNLGFPDWQQGFDGGIWSDWTKPSSDMQRPLTPTQHAVSMQSSGSLGSSGHNVQMGSSQHRSFYGSGSGSNTYNRGYMHALGHGNIPISNLGMRNQDCLAFDNSLERGRVSGSSLGDCNGSLDILKEQNRGPRASKPKTQITDELNSSADDEKHNKAGAKKHVESFNKSDFITEYNDATFFIIKSYSEDNVHKSIKYDVWASTPNGNRKLDTAYCEATKRQEPCPVFLFFSVNASAQFCGVAEMVGPVDFEKSVDYWQQDKWSGQFPVKWHIIKDVPNSQFRHIILENNDNKPVTNSRDTQEVVKLEQGVEILKIFKNYEAESSIVDDFDFYEEREKVIQERKARKQASLTFPGIVGQDDLKTAVAALPTDLIKHMSKSFAQAVCLDEGCKEADSGSPAPDTVTTAVSSDQPN